MNLLQWLAAYINNDLTPSTPHNEGLAAAFLIAGVSCLSSLLLNFIFPFTSEVTTVFYKFASAFALTAFAAYALHACALKRYFRKRIDAPLALREGDWLHINQHLADKLTEVQRYNDVPYAIEYKYKTETSTRNPKYKDNDKESPRNQPDVDENGEYRYLIEEKETDWMPKLCYGEGVCRELDPQSISGRIVTTNYRVTRTHC